MQMNTVCITTTSDVETERLGRRLAPLLGPGTVIALEGDLGAGKTVFTRGLARGLGIDEPVTSPTFNLVQEYQTPTNVWLFHLDMYRISTDDEALVFGIEDYLFSPRGITVVEWPERVRELLAEGPLPGDPGRLLTIRIAHAGLDCRRVALPEDLAVLLAKESLAGETI